MKLFAERLKQVREKQKRTQEETARAINVNAQTYRRYEQNLSEPRLERLVKIAKYFNVKVGYLLGLLDDCEPFC